MTTGGPRVILDHQFFHLDGAETDGAGVLPKATDLCSAFSLLPLASSKVSLKSQPSSLPLRGTWRWDPRKLVPWQAAAEPM